MYNLESNGFVCLGFFFNGISTFVGYLRSRQSLQKNSSGSIKNKSWENKGIHTSNMNICPKVNVKARLEFELTSVLLSR